MYSKFWELSEEFCCSNFESNPCAIPHDALTRPVEAGGQGAIAHNSDFDRSVNPISTWGTDYTHHIITCPPPPWIFRPSYGPVTSSWWVMTHQNVIFLTSSLTQRSQQLTIILRPIEGAPGRSWILIKRCTVLGQA